MKVPTMSCFKVSFLFFYFRFHVAFFLAVVLQLFSFLVLQSMGLKSLGQTFHMLLFVIYNFCTFNLIGGVMTILQLPNIDTSLIN